MTMNLLSLTQNQDLFEKTFVNIRDDKFEMHVKRKLTVSDNEYVNNNVPKNLEHNDSTYIIAMLTHMIHRCVRVEDEHQKLVQLPVDTISETFSIDELAAIVDVINETQGNKAVATDEQKDDVEKEIKKK